MNFGNLWTELNGRLHGTTSNAVYLDFLKTWVNLARKSIVNYLPSADFLQVETTVALVNGTGTYSLSSDVVKVNPEEIRLATTKARLSHLDPSDEGFIDLTTTGTPAHFRLSGYQSIQLYPPPNAAAVSANANLSYEYSKTFPTDMSSDSDTHGLPPHFEPVLLDLAEVLGWEYLRQFQQSQFAWQRAISGMQAYDPQNEFLKVLSLNLQPPAERTMVSGATP